MALGLHRHWNSWLVAKTSLVEIHIYIYIYIFPFYYRYKSYINPYKVPHYVHYDHSDSCSRGDDSCSAADLLPAPPHAGARLLPGLNPGPGVDWALFKVLVASYSKILVYINVWMYTLYIPCISLYIVLYSYYIYILYIYMNLYESMWIYMNLYESIWCILYVPKGFLHWRIETPP